ncbi:MAG: fibronectin type III domain-containing protein [Lachnospiraceae bacterium]|nr:fibronectin type III domain-containing protein [Lachnospiraceae bacterium]
MKTLIRNNRKGIFILLPMLMLLFSVIRVEAEEEKYYPKYTRSECIEFKGEKILDDRYFKTDKSVIKGSKSGTLTFDLDHDRIIFDNFKDESLEEGMNEYLALVLYANNSVTIELKGDNEIMLADGNCKVMFLNSDTNLIGPGTLTINGPIQCGGTFTVEDCDITINSRRFGMDVEFLKLCDADINVTTTAKAFYQYAFCISYMTMENSTLRGVSPQSYHCAPCFEAEDFYREYFDLYQIFTPKSNEIIIDDDGNTLYPVTRTFNHFKYFVFTKDVEAYNAYQPGNTALAVNIVSPSRLKQLKAVEQVKEKIAAIQTVTAGSGEKIQAARSAYDSLDSNIRYKVKNIDVLEKAEKTYKEINQKEANKVIAMISGLGTITAESGSKMEAVENAYDNLTADQKKLVSNYTDIKKAWLKFQKAVEQKEQDEWLREQEAFNEGIRSLSKEEFSQLQVSNTTNGVSVRSAVSKKKKTLTLKWKKEKNCSGYQIAYSTKQNFKSQKKILVQGGSKVSYTINNLTSKKTYFVRIRSYRRVNGKNSYGKWSKTYKVKIK